MRPIAALAAAGSNPIDAGRRNLLLLIQLRWLAVGGQFAAILVVRFGLGIALPIGPMLLPLALLVALNVLATIALSRPPITNVQLFASLLVDVGCLTAQLFLSGGVTNPFVTLYLLQVVLGAVLLEAWSSWALVVLTSAIFAGLAVVNLPLPLPPHLATNLSGPYVFGSWFNFTLAAVLLVLFVTRVAHNLRARDAHVAALRQQAAEEEHIVRMGLLASGAAHELATPLASLSVILGDWRNEPAVAGTPHLAAEVDEMRTEVARCKEILGGILFAAGEVTGEAPARTTLQRFVANLVTTWRRTHPDAVRVEDRIGTDLPIVADRALEQALTNLLDNALEAAADRIVLVVERDGGTLVLTVHDNGSGFADTILANLGKPYQSSKQRRGAGLGLFLSTNVLRTLGGTLSARNLTAGGAEVQMRVPLATIAPDDAR
jgi:two-component system sensor histidine kinase RegB